MSFSSLLIGLIKIYNFEIGLKYKIESYFTFLKLVLSNLDLFEV